MKAAFMRGLMTAAAADPRLMFITGDLGFGMIEPFLDRFPRQFLNVGVAEQNMLGVATGLALDGRTVFTYSIGNFGTLRCLEQIRNDAAYHSVNVNVVSMGGGFSYGPLGISHHATEDLAILRAIPGVTVVAPGGDAEAEAGTLAIASRPGVAYLRLDKMSADADLRPREVFEIGRARRLRDGDALTLVASGGVLKNVLNAADGLAARGVHCRVLSMHTIRPLDDAALIAAARETQGIVTVEEHVVDGGLGGAVAELCLESGTPPRRFKRLGLRDGFSSIVGSQTYLQQRYGLDTAAITNAVTTLLQSEGNTDVSVLEALR